MDNYTPNAPLGIDENEKITRSEAVSMVLNRREEF